MDVREAIALLSPTGIDPTKTYVIGGTSMTPQDVAAAMSPLTATQNYLLRAKFAGDSAPDLWAAFFIELMHKWGSSGGMAEKVCSAAIGEAVSPNRCPQCKGVGEAQIGSQVLLCGLCEGTGHIYPEVELRSPWDSRLDWCRKQLARLESEALAVVARRLT